MLKRIGTGVFCTDEEFLEFKALADKAQLDLPADLDKGPIPYPEGPWVDIARVVQKVALEKGLPDITGYYGLDEKGEFVTYSHVEEEDGNQEPGELENGALPSDVPVSDVQKEERTGEGKE